MRGRSVRHRESNKPNDREQRGVRGQGTAKEGSHISYNAIVGRIVEGLLIGAIVVGALACPVMMLLGRRGIGPGCAMMSCKPKPTDELGELRRRASEIEARIAELEVGERRAPSFSTPTAGE